MDGFDTYLILLPSGAGGHSPDADRLRVAAELHGYDGWLLGCRDHGRRRGRRRVVVTPLEVLGTPSGAICAALAAAGALRGGLRLGAGAGRRPAVSGGDPGAVGPDGTVRLRRYLRHANMHWFSAGCTDCGRGRPAPPLIGWKYSSPQRQRL
jgi:hypothetical protein